MERAMTRQESYVERRQLFKNIWQTAMHIDERDDIMNRPKVVKTLRLDEVDKCPVGKNKKQRIRNLRHVCKKILDFCDRQDEDDTLYEQWRKKVSMNAREDDASKPIWFAYEIMESILTPIYESELFNVNMIETDENVKITSGTAIQPQNKDEMKPKKVTRNKKNIKKSKSLFAPYDVTIARTTTSEMEECVTDFDKMSKPTSPIKIKRTILRTKSRGMTTKSVRLKSGPEPTTKIAKRETSDVPGEPTPRRKIIKKRSKRKKKSNSSDVARGTTSK